jgi:lipopolysaccharide biosynthesis protein
LLYEPIERKLRNQKEDLPFMLCWANENWTRRWNGLDNEVLISQQYSEKDDLDHIDFLIKIFLQMKDILKLKWKTFF